MQIRFVTALSSADLVVLFFGRPDLTRLVHDFAAPHAWVARDGADRALATLAAAGLWTAAAWLGAGLLVAAAAQLPGAAGRLALRICGIVLPRVLRQILIGTAGFGVLLTPVIAGAATPGPHAGISRASGTAHPLPAPAWPTSTPTSAPNPVAPPAIPSASSIPAPLWPSPGPATRTQSSPPATQPGTQPSSQPSSRPPTKTHSRPVGAARPPIRQRPSEPPPRTAARTVRAGDSLWLIAARRLGPTASASTIAADWPRWYTANRDVIGADPALIIPGQVLHAPAPNTEEARP